jgi:DNA-binding response OmpR family regulator
VAEAQVLVIDDSPTILKVVQLVLSKAGYRVRTAPDGEAGVYAAREERPDLILLDFVMPKMNGYQVCRALAESEELRDVPVVLMSAKGDQIGERFVKVMGIVDYITKPFSPDAITAVVDHTLGKYGRKNGEPSGLLPIPAATELPAAEETGPRLVAAEADAAQSADEPPPQEVTSPRLNDLGRRRKRALEALRDSLVQAAAAGDEPLAAGDDLAERVRAKLTDEALEAALGELGPTQEPGAVLEGDLTSVPLAEVLGLLQQQLQTGLLSIRRDGARVEVAFQRGKVEFAASDGLGEEFLLGRYLTAIEAISRQDLELFLQSRGASQKLIGAQLVKLSYVSPGDLRRALARQSCERIYEALRWSGGRFAFRATSELGPLAGDAKLELSVDGILMEGVRRVDEWHLIEREIDDFEAVFLRNEEAVREVGRAQLTREELTVLELVTGKHNVRDIVRQSRMSSFEVSKMLFRLRSIRLIRRRVAPVAV